MSNANVVDFPRPDRSEEFLHWVRAVTKDFSERYCSLNQRAIDAGANTYYFVVNHRQDFLAIFDEAADYAEKLRRKAAELNVPSALVEGFITQMQPTLARVEKERGELQQVIKLAEKNGHIPTPRPAPTHSPMRSSSTWSPTLNRFNDPPTPPRAPPSKDWTLAICFWGLLAFAAVMVIVLNNGGSGGGTSSPSSTSGSGFSLPVAPYAWTGFHNGKLSHGFGIRLKGSRGHKHH